MQKWCPEPLVSENTADNTFQPLETTGRKMLKDQSSVQMKFIADASLGNKQSMMMHLTPQERLQIYELVEHDVSAEYKSKLKQVGHELETVRNTERKRLLARWEKFADTMMTKLELERQQQMQTLASEAVNLALVVAEKLVHCHIEVDQQVLVRNLETVLYKLEAGMGCTIQVHPEDAEYLEHLPELKERFKINVVKADRRIERGGCQVEADGHEWDATLRTQIETLGDLVRNIMTVNDHTKEQPSDDEPEVE